MNHVYEIAGDASFDIRGTGHISELRVAGGIRALAWDTEVGTTVENLIQVRHPKGDAQLKSFRSATLNDFDQKVLVESVSPFLAPGRYRVEVVEHLDLDAYLDEASYDIETPTYYYGGGYSMVATQSRSQLREATVEWFRNEIRTGKRPLALGLCVNVDSCGEDDINTVFVLDGHHRLEAYRKEEKNPRVCALVRIDPPDVSAEHQNLPER